MATYKVLQDIEAEDKLVGPLSLRQFVYAGIAAVCFYICFLALTKKIYFLLGIFLPVGGIGVFFAFPWKGEQPTEIWALARLRFMLKPRIRIWNQSGVKEVVTVLAPRKVEVKPKTHNLSETEVKSRLKALAETIDSRGWATRNASYRFYSGAQQQSDRLINASDLNPDALPMDVFQPGKDILDDQNPIAQSLDILLNQASVAQRQRAIDEMNYAAQAVNTGMPQLPSAIGYNPGMPAMPVAPMAPASVLPSPLPPHVQAPHIPQVTNPAAQTQDEPVQASNASIDLHPQPQPDHGPATRMPQLPTPVAAPKPVATPEPFLNGMSGSPMPAAQPAPNYWFVNNQPMQSAQGSPFGLTDQAGQAARLMPTPGPSAYGMPPSAVAPYPSTPAAYGAPAGAPQTNAMLQPTYTPEPMTPPADPAILNLAHNNDLNVATLARQARIEQQKSADEVEVPLH